MVVNSQALNITNKISVTASALVILAAAILSFTALYDLFLQIGLFAGWLAVLFPLLFDLAELAAAVTVLNAKLQGENDRFAWGLVIGFTVAGMGANTAHAAHAAYAGRIDTAQFALAVVFTSLFPLSIALVTHLLKRTIERTINRAGTVEALADLQAQAAQQAGAVEALAGEVERLTARRDNLQAEIDHAKRNRPAAVTEDTRQHAYAILAERSGISGAELGRQLGKSERLGRKLKSEWEAEAEQQPEPIHANGNGNGVTK